MAQDFDYKKFWKAAERGKVNELHELLPSCPDVDYVDPTFKDGYTALQYAVLYGRVDAAVALLEAGADIEAATRSTHRTALSIACTRGVPDMVALIIGMGAKRNKKLADGSGVCDGAKGELVELVLKHSATSEAAMRHCTRATNSAASGASPTDLIRTWSEKDIQGAFSAVSYSFDYDGKLTGEVLLSLTKYNFSLKAPFIPAGERANILLMRDLVLRLVQVAMYQRNLKKRPERSAGMGRAVPPLSATPSSATVPHLGRSAEEILSARRSEAAATSTSSWSPRGTSKSPPSERNTSGYRSERLSETKTVQNGRDAAPAPTVAAPVRNEDLLYIGQLMSAGFRTHGAYDVLEEAYTQGCALGLAGKEMDAAKKELEKRDQFVAVAAKMAAARSVFALRSALEDAASIQMETSAWASNWRKANKELLKLEDEEDKLKRAEETDQVEDPARNDEQATRQREQLKHQLAEEQAQWARTLEEERARLSDETDAWQQKQRAEQREIEEERARLAQERSQMEGERQAMVAEQEAVWDNVEQQRGVIEEETALLEAERQKLLAQGRGLSALDDGPCSRCAELEDTYRNLENAYETLHTELEAVMSELDETERDNASLKSTMNALESQITRAADRLEESVGDDVFNLRSIEFRAERAEWQCEREQWARERDAHTAEVAVLREQVMSLLEADELQKNKAHTQDHALVELAKLRTEVERQAAEIEVLERQNDAVAEENILLEREIADVRNDNTRLNERAGEDVSADEAVLYSVRQQLKEVQERLKVEGRAHKKKEAKLTARRTEAMADAEDLRKMLAAVTSENDQLKRDMHIQAVRGDVVEKELREANDRLRSSMKEWPSTNSLRKSLLSDLSNDKDDAMLALTQQRDQAFQIIVRLTAERDILQGQLEGKGNMLAQSPPPGAPPGWNPLSGVVLPEFRASRTPEPAATSHRDRENGWNRHVPKSPRRNVARPTQGKSVSPPQKRQNRRTPTPLERYRSIRPEIGITLASSGEVYKAGLRISRVVEGKPAEAAGVREGDWLHRIGRLDVNTHADFQKAMSTECRPGFSSRFHVTRYPDDETDEGSREFVLTVDIGGRGIGSAELGDLIQQAKVI